jgi:small subunit ribosomal protein S9
MSAASTGRRKTAVAKVWVKPGDGKIFVNGKTAEEYFPTQNDVMIIYQPLEATDNRGKWEFRVVVTGGGTSGQAGAVRHGISRALALADPESRKALRKGGYLTRDSRMVERKKSGRPKARKRFQFSKR